MKLCLYVLMWMWMYQASSAKICQTIDIRNEAKDFLKLTNCTVIEGNLQIVLIDRASQTDYEKFHFPELVEVTGYVWLYRVAGLKSLSNIVPNLRVIRGKELLYNYALVVYEMFDLEDLGLQSLTEISRGYIRIEKNRQLCYIQTVAWEEIINWTRSTPGSAIGVVARNAQTCVDICPSDCQKIATRSRLSETRPRCWNANHCQRACPECSDSVAGCIEVNGRPEQARCCNNQCLGGCNSTADNCYVCQNIRYNNSCITKCPLDTYRYLDRRCMTREECVNQESNDCFKWRILQDNSTENLCVDECPAGYMPADDDSLKCIKCTGLCPKVCTGLTIDSIAAAEKRSGCTKINGNLEISISGENNVGMELHRSLGQIKEVTGFIKIYRSYSIVSLQFLDALEKIGGADLVSKRYSLYILDNENLEEIWDMRTHPKLNIAAGQIFFHSNRKLCYSKIQELGQQGRPDLWSQTDESDVSTSTNGDLASCAQQHLDITVTLVSNNMVVLSWTSYKTNDERDVIGYTVSYREADNQNLTYYSSRDACGSDLWKREIAEADSGSYSNQTATYLNPLKPYTMYAAFVQAITITRSGAISPIIYFTTLPDDPSSVRDLRAWPTKDRELTVTWIEPAEPNGIVEEYFVMYIPMTLNTTKFELRNYCNDTLTVPPVSSSDVPDPPVNSSTSTTTPLCTQCLQQCQAAPTPSDSDGENKLKKNEHVDAMWFEDYLINKVYIKKLEVQDSTEVFCNLRRKRDLTSAQSRRESDEPVAVRRRRSTGEDLVALDRWHQNRQQTILRQWETEQKSARKAQDLRAVISSLGPEEQATVLQAFNSLEVEVINLKHSLGNQLAQLEQEYEYRKRMALEAADHSTGGVVRSVKGVAEVRKVIQSIKRGDRVRRMAQAQGYAFMLHPNVTNSTQLLNNSIITIEGDTNKTQVIPEVRYKKVSVKNATSVILTDLPPFEEYAIEVFACHAPFPDMVPRKCSNRAMVSARTLPDPGADVVDVTTVKVINVSIANKNHTVWVSWSEPARPNGVVVTYTLEFEQQNKMVRCVTRKAYHAAGNGTYMYALPPGNWTLHIYVTSLAGRSNKADPYHFYVPHMEAPSVKIELIVGLVVGAIVLIGMASGFIVYYAVRRKSGYPAGTLVVSINDYYIPAQEMYIPDDWEVKREDIDFGEAIGSGSFGDVRIGYVESVGKLKYVGTVAAKTTKPEASVRDRIEFLKEASIMKKFATEHVVKFVGMVSKGQPALVLMEYMALGDLKTFLRSIRGIDEDSRKLPSPDTDQIVLSKKTKKRPIDQFNKIVASLKRPDRRKYPTPTMGQVMQMAAEIADGMYYLHHLKFIHRDLAARNCMVSADMIIKIGDFGMTRNIHQTDYYRKNGKALLPVRWMAPESLRDGVFTNLSDVWSFGVVLWEIATLAQQPYMGLGNEEVVDFVIHGNFMERPEGCPQDLYSLMRHCWAFHEVDRPTFGHIIEALTPFVSLRYKSVSFYHNSSGCAASKAATEASAGDWQSLVPSIEGAVDADSPAVLPVESTHSSLSYDRHDDGDHSGRPMELQPLARSEVMDHIVASPTSPSESSSKGSGVSGKNGISNGHKIPRLNVKQFA